MTTNRTRAAAKTSTRLRDYLTRVEPITQDVPDVFLAGHYLGRINQLSEELDLLPASGEPSTRETLEAERRRLLDEMEPSRVTVTIRALDGPTQYRTIGQIDVDEEDGGETAAIQRRVTGMVAACIVRVTWADGAVDDGPLTVDEGETLRINIGEAQFNRLRRAVESAGDIADVPFLPRPSSGTPAS